MAARTAANLRTVGNIVDDLPPIGHNNPPPPSPYELAKLRQADLAVTAAVWLDGAEITSEAQATEVGAFIKQAFDDRASADTARIAEKKPHDAAAAAVQALWKPLVDDADKLHKIGKALATKWLVKLDTAQRERERIALAAAEEAAIAATLAHKAAIGSTDLDTHAKAEAAIADGLRAAAELQRAENAKAQVTGAGRAIGLRTYWAATITDPRAALNHYAKERRPQLLAWLQAQADADARGDRGVTPGVAFVSDQRA